MNRKRILLLSIIIVVSIYFLFMDSPIKAAKGLKIKLPETISLRITDISSDFCQITHFLTRKKEWDCYQVYLETDSYGYKFICSQFSTSTHEPERETKTPEDFWSEYIPDIKVDSTYEQLYTSYFYKDDRVLTLHGIIQVGRYNLLLTRRPYDD